MKEQGRGSHRTMLSRILLALVCCCCSLSWALAREPIRLPLRHVKAQIRERFLTPDSYYDYVAASSDDTSTVLAGSSVTPLKFNLADSSYRLDIALGVPPQQFSVILNTEDGAFWVTDSTCNDTSDWSPCDDCGFGPMCIRTCTASCCGGKSTLWRETAEKLSRRNPATLDTEDPLCGAGTRKFNSKLSTTYTKTTKTYSNVDTIYDGYMAGKVGEDVLSIGSLKIPALFFGQTTSLTEYELFYDNFTIEGVLGVGYSAVTLPNTLPPLYLAYNDGLLEIPVFSLYLSAGSGGEVTFGGFPSPSLCASNAIDWHDTKGAARYDVTVQSVLRRRFSTKTLMFV